MNAATIATSPRLQRLLAVRADGGEHSTRDLISAAQICAVNSAVAELRHAGLVVHCAGGKRDGLMAYRYRLDRAATQAEATRLRRAARRCDILVEEDPGEDADELRERAAGFRNEADRLDGILNTWAPVRPGGDCGYEQ